MINLTDIIGKIVINLYSGKALGTVENAVLTARADKLTYFSVFDEDSEVKQYIPCRYILNAQNNAVIVKNFTMHDSSKIVENCPLKSPLYNFDGTFKGIIEDIVVSETFQLLYIKDNNQNIVYKNNIVSFSKDAVIVCFDTEKLEKFKRIKPKIKTPEQIVENKVNEEISDTTIEETNLPLSLKNIVPPLNYLIGRKTTAPLYDSDNKIIVDKNSVITGKIIDRCRKVNKLISLAKNSKET